MGTQKSKQGAPATRATDAAPETQSRVKVKRRDDAPELPPFWSVSRLAADGSRERCRVLLDGVVVHQIPTARLAPSLDTVRAKWGSGKDYKIRFWSAQRQPAGSAAAFDLLDASAPPLPAYPPPEPVAPPPPPPPPPPRVDAAAEIAEAVRVMRSGGLSDDLDRVTALLGIVRRLAADEVAQVRATAEAEIARIREASARELRYERERLEGERRREAEHMERLTALSATGARDSELRELKDKIARLEEAPDDGPSDLEPPRWVMQLVPTLVEMISKSKGGG